MKSSIVPVEAPTLGETKTRRLDRWARQMLFSLLRVLRQGRLTIIDGDVRRTFGEIGDEFSLQATITVHHRRFYSNVVFAGSVAVTYPY